MEKRPIKIDELSIEDHFYLALGEDDCYYFGSYFKHDKNNPDNSLIYNLKKKPSKKLTDKGYHYKDAAIKKIAGIFSNAFSDVEKKVTFVPIPPSKIVGHADYDDRMTQILHLAFPNGDVRELIENKVSTDPTHSKEDRLKPKEIKRNIRINEAEADDIKSTIFLVDDMLTTGAHFVAVKEKLQERFEGVDIVGVFVCRRVIIHDTAKDDFADDLDF